jgi:hypothetical protein
VCLAQGQRWLKVLKRAVEVAEEHMYPAQGVEGGGWQGWVAQAFSETHRVFGVGERLGRAPRP